MSLRRALSTPDSKSRYVRRLFATIADRYDFVTVFLSFGRDRHWKARLTARAEPWRGGRALDLACGTGDLTFQLAAQDLAVVGLDVTPRMITLAREKGRRRRTSAGWHLSPLFLVGDMMGLPFADETFDVITTGYGIRNVPRLEPALAEIHRVLRPGGRFLSLDFDRPEQPLLRAIYLSYLTVVGSVLGLMLHGAPHTYGYIPASIRRYPGSRGVVELMRRSGFRDVEHTPLLGSLMAIHGGSR